MLDAKLRPLIDPPLNSAGKGLAKAGFSANAVTMIGLISGLAGAFAIYSGIFWLALLLIISNRILDGLDGAIARVTGKTAFGGYLDIVCDFIFYISVPLSFGFADPQNMPYALALVSAFTLTGVSFLAYATIATQHGLATTRTGEKSFFYSTGIAEGAETILFFLLMCLFPSAFTILAAIFTVLCAATVLQRSLLAWHSFKG